ncbi:hypothetical protein C8R44DRAFT_834477 [Mycena epipterygia]|nr:hypothetical protein C8R44DRAFT_834477 [Mycena epipterygia]
MERLAELAAHANRGTNYKYLNYEQTRKLLIQRTKENNDLKLKTTNDLVIAIATNDLPRVNALLNTAIRNGASVNTMTAQIIEANDLSILIYRLGGQSLLYSLNHALGLPSLRTIGNSANFVKVTPTLGPISIDEIKANIKHVVLETRALAGKWESLGCATGWKGPFWKKKITLVAANFANDPDIYPILAAPTCKHETAEDMMALYTMIMQAWEEVAAPTWGDIKNFATDGDGIRDSTLVRQPRGIVVDTGRVVNPIFLGECLNLLPEQDEKSVHNPNTDDPMDVPRAIDLVEAIVSLRDVEPPAKNVELAATLDSIRLLGYVFENLLVPFITPSVSLSEQIKMLSTYAHLSFVLFREYHLDFMSNQLYGDTQTTIKTLFSPS